MLEATESNYFHPRFVQSFYTLAFQPKNPITGPFISDPDLRSNFDYFHSSGNEGYRDEQSKINKESMPMANRLHTNSQVLELNFGHNGVRFNEENKSIRTDDLG